MAEIRVLGNAPAGLLSAASTALDAYARAVGATGGEVGKPRAGGGGRAIIEVRFEVPEPSARSGRDGEDLRAMVAQEVRETLGRMAVPGFGRRYTEEE